MFKYKTMNVSVLKTSALFLTGTALIMLSSCSGGQQQQATAPKIATLTVSYSSANLESSYPASIKGKADIEIRPQVTGFITKVHVDEGQRVKKGEVLFTIDQVQYQAAVDQAAAAVKVAETAVATAQLTADNKRALFDKNIISEYEWQLAENSLEEAKAQLKQAQASLVNAQKDLSYTIVVAPSDGVVGTIPNREGSLASPSSTEPLTTVSENSQVYAYFSLNEKDILDMTNNGEFSLDSRINAMPEVKLLLSDGELYPKTGKVATVSGVIDNTTGAASVRALFDNTNGMIRSGSSGSILIPHPLDSIILIPQKATYEVQDNRYVYLVNDSNITKSQQIQIYNLDDGNNYIVTAGLKPNDRIVIEGVGVSMQDGMKIDPVETKDEESQQGTQTATQQ